MRRDGQWRIRAACRPDVCDLPAWAFIPEPGKWRDRPELTAQALKACEACPVRAACERDAATHRIRFGVWGGRLLGTDYEKGLVNSFPAS